MIAFGALSGGVASELSGGNFWEGAITGGIVAGLNHAMHKLGEEYTIDSYLRDAGYDPRGKPTLSKDYSNEMIKKVSLLKRQKELAKGKGRVAGYYNKKNEHGYTDMKTGHIFLSTLGLAAISNRGMAIVLYHEIKHLVYYWNPHFSSLLKYSGQKRKDYEHHLIHLEVSNILLNGTLTYGTRHPLEVLYKKYNYHDDWKYK